MGGCRGGLGLCLLLLAMVGPGGALQNVTAQLFGVEAYGTLAAFGDFNSDKQTDLFVLRGGNELIIFLADQKEPYFKPRVKLPMKALSVTITSVVPGDYDGDSQMDVLLTTRAQNHGRDELSVFIFWGHNQTLDLNHKTMLNKTFHDEPLVMDFNGDLIPDVFGVTSDSSKPQILIGGQHHQHLSKMIYLDKKAKITTTKVQARVVMKMHTILSELPNTIVLYSKEGEVTAHNAVTAPEPRTFRWRISDDLSSTSWFAYAAASSGSAFL